MHAGIPGSIPTLSMTRLGWQSTSSCTSGFDLFPGARQVTRGWQEKEVTLL